MKYKREAETLLSHPPETGKRSTIPFPGTAAQRMIPRRATGWDPYEVWRTRVKTPARETAKKALDKTG